jgi:hypothetical protein
MNDQELTMFFFPFDCQQYGGLRVLGVMMKSIQHFFAEAARRAFEGLLQELKKSGNDNFIEALEEFLKIRTTTKSMRRNSTSTSILMFITKDKTALFPSLPSEITLLTLPLIIQIANYLADVELSDSHQMAYVAVTTRLRFPL